jgi:hypothetical protein
VTKAALVVLAGTESGGAREQVEAAEVALLDDFEEHPSLRSYLADGYQVLTF